MTPGNDPEDAPRPDSKVPPESELAEGLAAHRAGDLDLADRCYRAALEREPDHARALHLWGTLALQQGRHREAATALARSTAAYARLLERLAREGRDPDVASLRQQVTALNTVHAETYCSWGARLLAQRRHHDAEAALRQAVAIQPGYAEALFNLGSVLHLQGRLDEAADALREALTLRGDLAEAHYLLGAVLTAQGRPAEAVACQQEAIALRPDYAAAHNVLGLALQELDRLQEAADAFRRALAADPAHVTAHANLIFLHTYHRSRDSRWLLEECRRFYEAHGAPHEPAAPTFANSREPGRRLRVGYLSADLRNHVIASNLEPLLAAHDPREVEVICYASVQRPDEVTGRFQQLAHRWRDVAGQDDAAVAQMIREDGVDLLVDLGWYTADSRLLVLARRPAPVQVAYLGAFATTGFPVVDWWITDRWLHAEDSDEPHTEALHRLDRCFACYQAWPQAGEVVTPPPDRPVTFGSFNTLWKLNHRVVALWAEVLRRAPGSRLLLKAKQLADDQRAERLRQAFAAHGVDPARLDLRPAVTLAEHYALYGEVDVALDPFPFTGGVTTFDALWMGAPVITLAGDRFTGRMSVTQLAAIGRTEWIAETPEQYVDLAVDLANDGEARRRARADQRQRVERSPLCDGPGLARALEQAYRQMWRRWLEQ